MANESDKPTRLVDIGRKLVNHSKSAEFSAARGLVIELFPFIFEASERMSARAISRFLAEHQNIKLSAVTITKALNDPKKSWLAFFEGIESAAIVTAKYFRPSSFKFLFVTKSEYETRVAPDATGKITQAFTHGVRAFMQPERAEAHKFLIEKWFSIALATRLKAKTFLDEHLMELTDNL